MTKVSSGKTRGSHPHRRRKNKNKNKKKKKKKKKNKKKKKKYVKFPKRLEKLKKTVSEQLQDELEPILSTPINSPMSDE